MDTHYRRNPNIIIIAGLYPTANLDLVKAGMV